MRKLSSVSHLRPTMGQDRGAMPHWKLLLVPLAVVVAGLAYLAGAVAGDAEGPARPEPVVLQDGSSVPDEPRDDRRGEPRERPADRGDDGPARDDDREDDRGAEEGDDDDTRVRVVVPEPTEVHDEDDGPEGDDDDSRDGGDGD
jgi:hypothetical protein